MYVQANKQKNGNQVEDKRNVQKVAAVDSVAQFQDNRPEFSKLSNIQDAANTSHQAKKITQLQEMTDPGSSKQNIPVQKRENTTGLPDGLKSGVENLSGHSLDDVKVHFNSDKPSQLQAHAYAQGTDIHVAPGQEKHLPHEAWHVAQQKQGRVRPTLQMKTGVAVNDDTGLEKEADVMGEKALQFVQTGESEGQNNSSSQTGKVAQLQEAEDSVSEDESDQEETDEEDEELKKLLEKLSGYSLGDLDAVDESDNSTDESGLPDEGDSSAVEIDDSEEIQLAKKGSVIQAMRTPPKRDKTYYLKKLLKSYRNLIKTRDLLESGEARLKNKKEYQLLDSGFEKTPRYFFKLKDSIQPFLSVKTKSEIDRLLFFNNRLYFSVWIPKLKRDHKELVSFLSKSDVAEVNTTAVANWHRDIKSKNKKILHIINSSTDTPTQHPWFLMDYEDIVDNQAEKANEAIEAGINHLMITGDSNLDYVKNNILPLVSNGTYYLPLVTFKSADFYDINESRFIGVDYQINPSYTKYVDPTKKGQGSQAIKILGDSKDVKVKTDIRFIPGSLTVGDETSQVGIQMEAVRLSQDSPIGSEAGKDTSQNAMMDNLEKTLGDKRTKYIKGHLLNDHLGGPARPYNLFPITDQANSDHLVFMEKYVKAEVEKGYVMYYKVNIANHSVKDLKPKQKKHGRRYTVNADIQCESAKIDKSDKPIEKHNITVKSVWSGGEVLDSTGNRIRRKSDPSKVGSELATHADYTRKVKPGKVNEGVTNPDVKAPDPKVHLIHKKSGYDQEDQHKGKLSDSDIDSTVKGAIPFTIGGDQKDDISKALQPAVASAVGKHIAGLIWSSSFITGGKLKVGITESELISIKGVGPATIAKLKKDFEIK